MKCPSCGHKDVPLHEKIAKGSSRYICYACHNTFVTDNQDNSISTQAVLPNSNIQLDIETNHSKIMVLSLAITTFFFAKLLALHFSMVLNPFQNEYREGAILLSTKLIVEGGNLYSWANQPEYSNNYGIMYHLVVYPFAKLFGATFIVHRTISAFFIFASCIVLFISAHRMKVPLALCFAGTTIFYAHLLYFAAPLSRPDSLGMFLFLCSIYIPWKFNYSKLSLLSSIIIGILSLLTKPYFILGIFYVGIYVFLFKSKKLGLKYFFAILISLGSTILLINSIFECYWYNTFFINVGAIQPMEYPEYPIIQIYRYIEYNISIVTILFLIVFDFSRRLERRFQKNTKIKFFSKYINFISLDKPLFTISGLQGSEWIIYMILSLGLFYFKLGRHNGSWLVYIHHLISPFLILIILQFISKNKLGKSILIVLLCLNLFSITKIDFLQSPQLDNTKWEEVKTLISEHNNVLNSPAITAILIEQDKKVYDSGLTEYFQYGIKRSFLGINLPDDQFAKAKNERFIQDIKRNIESKKFDLITMTDRFSLFVSEDELQKYYQYKSSITVPMASTFQNWKLDIWEPKS
jgi:hypothetical protein